MWTMARKGITVTDPAYLVEQLEAAVARKDWGHVKRLSDELTVVNDAIAKYRRRAPAPRRVTVKG